MIDISISQEDFENLTLEKLRKNALIFNTHREAYAKGFEAHHLEPISVQIKNYNDLHGTNIPTTGKDKREFEKLGLLDDRCARYTPFEHILDHYLLAKERGGYYTATFFSMIHLNERKLSIDEVNLLNTLKDIAILREQGRKKSQELLRIKLANLTEEEHKKLSDLHKEISNRPEVKEKIRKADIERFASMTADERLVFRLHQKETHNTNEAIKHIIEGQRRRLG